MFLGHYGVALGTKAIAPRTSLGTLVLASLFVDLLWPVLLLLGLEQVVIKPGTTRVTPLDFVYYPFSHSLLAALVWAMLFGCIYLLLKRYYRGAVVAGLLVLSHWLLDAIVHRPDLPLYPGSRQFIGLGLWSSLLGTLVLELLIFALGVWLYFRSTVSRDATGGWALWVLVILLVGIYLASVFGTPPPTVTVLAWVGQAQWLFVFWAYWIDRHRQQAA